MIRKDVSAILKYSIPKNGWEKAFRELERDGRITKKHMVDILLLILKRLEVDEGK